MDQNNYRDVRSLARESCGQGKNLYDDHLPGGMKDSHVPDPYYRGEEGFEYVLDIIENASLGLMARVKEEIKRQHKAL